MDVFRQYQGFGSRRGTSSSVSLDRFLDDNFFKPLGMKDTFYTVPSSERERVVTTHRALTGS